MWTRLLTAGCHGRSSCLGCVEGAGAHIQGRASWLQHTIDLQHVVRGMKPVDWWDDGTTHIREVMGHAMRPPRAMEPLHAAIPKGTQATQKSTQLRLTASMTVQFQG